MQPEALLVNRPAIDFDVFIGVSHKVLGYNVAAAADTIQRRVSGAERFLSCLAALRDSQAAVGLPPKLLAHVSFSVLVVADERDMLDILECAAMPFVAADTLARGVQTAVITGTLNQWRDAVASGSSLDNELPVRGCFNKVYSLFCNEGLNVWTDFNTHQAPDQVTFLLEDKRR
jgi:hypothetical protein